MSLEYLWCQKTKNSEKDETYQKDIETNLKSLLMAKAGMK